MIFDWALVGGPSPWGPQLPINLGAPGLVLATVLINLLTFRFRTSGGISLGKRKREAAAPAVPAVQEIDLPKVQPSLNSAGQQFASRLNFEIKGVVFNVAFWILLALGLFNTVPGFFLGLIESYLYGWYIALVFVPLYNYFNRGNVRSG